MDRALKKLRFKFIAVIMSIMAVLLIVVFSTICAINYQQELASAYEELDRAVSNDEGMKRYPPADMYGDLYQNPDGGRRFEFGRKKDGERFIPVAVYAETSDGSLYHLETRSPFTLSQELLDEAISRIANAGDGEGALPALGLLYAKRSFAYGTLIAFADDSAVSSWKELVLTLAVVGIATLLVFFLISLALSKWALRPVEKAWKDQRRFIADASHELKTPLTVMSANTAILQKNMDKTIASQSQWVESTEDEIANMRELVDDLLFIASTDGGESVRQVEQVDFSKLVQGQLLQFESLAYENGIELDSSIDEGVKLEGDRARLQRLVRTLLDNACKYAGRGASVRVELKKEPHATVLTVANTGAVISPEDLPHVFERFYRADKARVRESGGYGLGLSIAHDVAEEHGATLNVASSEETGTVFRVEWNK